MLCLGYARWLNGPVPSISLTFLLTFLLAFRLDGSTALAANRAMPADPESPMPERVAGWTMVVARALLAVAMVVAGYLAWASFTGGALAGCGPASGCDKVLHSRWSYWLGVPVSAPALGVYVVLLAATFATARRGAWIAVMVLSVTVAGSALWFTGLQVYVLKSLCKYCLAAHGCGFLASALLLATTPVRSMRAVTVGCAGVAMLVLGQVLVVPPQHLVVTTGGASAAVPSRNTAHRLALHEGRYQLALDELPIFGPPDAPQVVVSLYDYTCPWCRKMHAVWLETQRRKGDALAIVLVPMPMSAACNTELAETPPGHEAACEYVRLGLAVWRAKRAAWPEFDAWMFTPEKPPPAVEARAFAEKLVGREALDAALRDPWIDAQIRTGVALYAENSRALRSRGTRAGDSRAMPQATVNGMIVVGAIEKAEEIDRLLARKPGPPPGGQGTAFAEQVPSSGEMQALRDEIAGFRRAQDAMQKDVKDIKRMLQPAAGPRPGPIGARVAVAGSPFRGDAQARVTLIEFSDYQCQFSNRYRKETLPEIERAFIGTARVKYVFRDLPLPFHKDAIKAAEASRCAGEQGKFQDMRERLFANQQALTPGDLLAHAEVIGLDGEKFRACVDSGKYADAVKADAAEAVKLGLTATPGFVLGVTEPNEGKIKVLKAIVGAEGYAEFEAAIESVLALPNE